MSKKQVLFVPVGLVLLGIVVLLLIEIVPNPPLMAPELKPTPEMVGKWKGTARLSVFETTPQDLQVEIEVRPDTVVTGWVGGARISAARIANNRSWLGKRLGLRSDYIIIGSAQLPSGEHAWEFTIPMSLHDGMIKGALFIEGKPRRLTLFRAEPATGNRPPGPLRTARLRQRVSLGVTACM